MQQFGIREIAERGSRKIAGKIASIEKSPGISPYGASLSILA
jgi:hypothetical protein